MGCGDSTRLDPRFMGTSALTTATLISWSTSARWTPTHRVDAYFGLLDDLRRILGTEIDLVMVDAVKNRYVAADIERTKQAFYAA